MIDQDIFSSTVNFFGVKGLVFIGDKILVYRRDNKTKICPLLIDLPGGGREGKETPLETFSREVKEEFGININKDDVVFAKKYQGIVDSSLQHYFFITKSLNIKETDLILGNEGVEFYLLYPQTYLELTDAVENQQKRVKEYLILLKTYIKKTPVA